MRRKLIIIAEIGINHNGSLKLAKKLAKEAKNSGADYVKIQNYDPESIVTKSTPKASYQRNPNNYNEKIYNSDARFVTNFS